MGTWLIVLCYFVVTITYTVVSVLLLCWHHGGWTRDIRNILIVLLFLGFVYTPLISYVTARLEGMVGQIVEVPFIREASLILSGYKGVACWFLPIPIANYGGMTVFYRQCELTGTKFTSVWKAQVILYPIILISSIFFMNFIWGLGRIPSSAYPYAQKMWELDAANQCIMYSSTLPGEYSMFEEAFNWNYMGLGTLFGVVLFASMRGLGAPIMFTYGLIRGLGQSVPHWIVPQFIGALIGHYYFRRRLGLRPRGTPGARRDLRRRPRTHLRRLPRQRGRTRDRLDPRRHRDAPPGNDLRRRPGRLVHAGLRALPGGLSSSRPSRPFSRLLHAANDGVAGVEDEQRAGRVVEGQRERVGELRRRADAFEVRTRRRGAARARNGAGGRRA